MAAQGMNAGAPHAHRLHVQVNLRYLFGGAILALLVLIQGGPNSYYWSALIMTLAFLYFRPRAARQQQQQPINLNQANNNNNNNAQHPNPNANPNNMNNNPQQNQANANGRQERNGFDDMEHDPHAGNWDNVPAVLRYDWRHHTGVVGEALGFFCPLVFSLWPSWDPSLLGDHPDLIRRRQQEAAAAAAASSSSSSSSSSQQQQQQQAPPAEVPADQQPPVDAPPVAQ